MDRRPRFRRPPAVGFLAGALAGLLIGQLGFLDLVGWGTVLFSLTMAALGGLAASLGGATLVSIGTSALLVIWALVALTPVVSGPASRWVRADGRPGGPVDAVVVLSSGLASDTSLDASGTERLMTGLAAVRATGAPRLVTTRVRAPIGGRMVSSDRAQERLVGLLDPRPEWLVADSVASTRDEAVRAAAILIPQGLRRIALVTSPIHTRRACATFEAVGFSVFCVAAVEVGGDTRRPRTPGDRLEASRAYLRERLAMVKYGRSGWLRADPR